MSRPQLRNKYSKSSSNIENVLFRKWNAVLTLSDNYFNMCFEKLYKAVKKATADGFHLAVCSEKGLSVCDEEIFEHYKRIIDTYGSIAKSYAENGHILTNPAVKLVADGIVSVLKSREREFYEREQSSAAFALKLNPVTLEKKSVIINGLRAYNRKFDEIFAEYRRSGLFNNLMEFRLKLLGDGADYNTARDFFGGVYDDIAAMCRRTVFDIYEDCIKQTITDLNDLEGRVEASHYYNAINEEYEILSSLIISQTAALETEIRVSGIPDGERDTVNILLDNLKEAFQYYSMETASIVAFFKEASDRNMRHGQILDISEDDFFAGLDGRPLISEIITGPEYDSFFDEYSVKLRDFKLIFENELVLPVFNAKKKFALSKCAFEKKRMVSEVCGATVEIEKVFKDIYVFYAENAGILSKSMNHEIIKGIIETIEIKLESLREAREAFSADAETAISESAGGFEGDGGIQELIKSCYIELTDSIAVLSKDDRRVIIAINRFISDINSGDAPKTPFAKTENKILAVFETLDKKVFSFKKESLLFEISTFEEVMNYSVSRLRESGDLADALFVGCVDTGAAEIIRQLKLSGIELIRPNPHDMFNGREHEVLMAEKNEEFSKGEIIKLLNSGYRQHDNVIIRANVIACK